MATTKNLATVPSTELSNAINLLAEVNGEIVRLPYSLIDEKLVPLEEHMDNENNPHKLDADDIGAATAQEVQELKTEFSEYKISNDAELAQQKSDLAEEVTCRQNAVATEKAERKAEIATERARIDSLVALGEGSTTGDAELMDARIDHDGNTHDCAGDAIRYQTRKLDNELNNVFNDGDNLLKLKDKKFDLKNTGLTVEFKDGKILINGTAEKDVRINLSGNYDFTINNTTPDTWLNERVDWIEVGEIYCSRTHLIGGNPESGTSTVIVSVRNTANQSVISATKNPAIATDNLAYVLLYISYGATFNNAVYYPVIEKNNEVTPIEELIPRYISETVRFAENSIYTKALFYKCVKELKHEVIHQDELSEWIAVQGMCSDGEYLYYSLVRQVDSNNTLLCKYSIADDSVILTKENHSYGHANGIAYIPNENALYICNMDTTGTISKVNPETLEFIEEFSLYDVLSPVVPWYMGVGAVAYDTTKEKIVFLLRGVAESDGRTRKGFAIFDKEMRFEKIIKTEFIPSDSYSGLCTDENFIYLTVTNPTTTSRGEWLVIYDWYGNEVTRVELPDYNHVEAQAKIGDLFYFADNRNFKGATIVKATPKKYEYISKLDILLQYNLN